MKRLLQIILVLTMASVIACAAGRHTREGNKQFAEKNYETAVKEYEQALALKPALSDDAMFRDRLKEARAEVFYEEGYRFEKQLKWDEAIERYTRCLELNADHAPAREALIEARKESSKVHLQAGLSLADSGNLYGAIDELARSVELDPDNRTAQDALNMSLKVKKGNERKAEEHFKTGMSYFQNMDWNKSVAEFGASIAYNPSHVLAGCKAKEAKDRIDSANDLYNRGMEFFDRKDWDPATDQFEAALRVSPFFQEPRKRIEEAAESKKQAEWFSLRGDTSFEEKRWDEAITAYRRALDLAPNHGPSQDRLVKALHESAEKHSTAGMALLDKSNAGRAVVEFTSALECVPDFSVAREGLAEIFYRQGSDFESAGKLGNALIEFRKALLMVPDYPNSRQKTAAIEQWIAQRTTFRVGLLPLSSRPKDAAVSRNLGERLLNSLIKRDMSPIQVLEQPSLNRILQEHQLSTTDLMKPNAVFPAGGIKGLDIIISGQVSSFEMYSRESITPKSQRYQSGTRRIINYAYDSAQQDLWDLQDKVSRERDYVARYKAEYNEAGSNAFRARNQYQDLNRKWSGDCSLAESLKNSNELFKKSYEKRNCEERRNILERLRLEMNNAQHRLRNIKYQLDHRTKQLDRLESALRSARNRILYTDRYLDKPVYNLWHYRIHHVTKHCSLSVTFRAIDATGGSMLFSSTVGKTAEDRDDYVDNPNPSAGVHGDPLVLKSDTELISRVADVVIAEITDHIAASLKTYGNKYFRLGNEAARDAYNEEAVERYIKFLCCCPECDPSDRTKAMVFIKKTRNYGCDDIGGTDCEGYWGVHTEDAESQKDLVEKRNRVYRK